MGGRVPRSTDPPPRPVRFPARVVVYWYNNRFRVIDYEGHVLGDYWWRDDLLVDAGRSHRLAPDGLALAGRETIAAWHDRRMWSARDFARSSGK